MGREVMTGYAGHDEILGWVRERLKAEPEPGSDAAAGLLERNLGLIMTTARLSMEAINRFQGEVRVEDRNKYEFIKQRLPEIITFEEFSLAEYTLHLSKGGTPGIRLWLTSSGFTRILQVLYFPDVLAWRVDREGRRVREIILELDMSAERPRIKGKEAPDGSSADWPDILALALSRAAVRDSGEIVPQSDSI